MTVDLDSTEHRSSGSAVGFAFQEGFHMKFGVEKLHDQMQFCPFVPDEMVFTAQSRFASSVW